MKPIARFDGRALRSTSSVESFPWLVRVVTLVRVTSDGVVSQAKTDADKRAMLGAADDRDLLLAAWPGDWSQDIFVVDDLKGARLSVGLPRKQSTPSGPAQQAAAPTLSPSYHPPGGLWRRLAELADLPVEGRRQIVGQVADRSRDTAAALLARPDLDQGMRRLLLESVSAWIAGELADSEHCTDQDVAILAGRFPDSASVLQAALRRAECREAVREKLAALSYMEAARLWMDSRAWGVGKRPELAAAIVPAVLAAEGSPPTAGYNRYERGAVVRSLAADLSPEQRLELLRNPDYGQRAQQAFLTAGTLTDDELMECLPEITRRQHQVPAEKLPALVQHIRQFPQLIEIAEVHLVHAAAQLVTDGWSPLRAARSGQWEALVTLARVAVDPDLIDALLAAALFDRADSPGHRLPWHNSHRYELLELLLGKTLTKDSQIRSALELLTDSEVDDLSGAAGKRSRVSRLCVQTLKARQAPSFPAAHPRTSQLPKLLSDEELSATADPRAALLAMLRDRSGYRDRVIDHVLNSAYMTDDLAWRLPVQALENHPVYGPRLAARIAQICGDSAERWKALASSWAQPTQLLASTLFKRLHQTNGITGPR